MLRRLKLLHKMVMITNMAGQMKKEKMDENSYPGNQSY